MEVDAISKGSFSTFWVTFFNVTELDSCLCYSTIYLHVLGFCTFLPVRGYVLSVFGFM